MTSAFGYIPKVAEKCHWNGFTFEVVDMDRARIDKILVTREENPEEQQDAPDKECAIHTNSKEKNSQPQRA